MAINGGHAGTKEGPNWGHIKEFLAGTNNKEFKKSGTKKEHKPKLLSQDISGVVGVFHMKGWGPKSSVCPSKPGKSNFFGEISRDFGGISGRCPKSLRK